MPSPTFTSIAGILERQARQFADRTAFVFEDDCGQSEALAYQTLVQRSRTLGAWLARRVHPGDRVVLVYPPGLEFISAFLGCVYTGALPVPATYPKPRRPMPRLDSIVADCRPSLVLTHSSVVGGMCFEQQSPAISQLTWESTDQIPTRRDADFAPVPRTADDLAFLQYTSGSTSEPRGVMVSHGNLLHNLEAIRKGFEIFPDENPQAVFWLPAYHDMGLIGGILTPLYVGGTSTLIAPTTFLRRPQRWLELVSLNQASISGAPNFGYELAVKKTSPAERAELDLSRWRFAFCGAEPINPYTLSEFAAAFAGTGFKRSAFFPCYGLAESTLMVTGGQTADGPRVLEVDRRAIREHKVVCSSDRAAGVRAIIGCGSECSGLEVEIVDPQTHAVCGTNEVGEIWVRGDSIARGYWDKDDVNAEIFRARIAPNGANHSGEFLRTGDLGFRHEGELFVTGRLKDVIIVRGRNHYPQDLERTAQSSHEAVDVGAAFSVEIDGREELVLVHQWRRECRDADQNQMIHAMRTAIVAEHEIDPHAIVLIRPASLPVTSSGKVQRQRCREMYLSGELLVTSEWINEHCSGDDFEAVAEQLSGPPVFLNHIGELSHSELQVCLRDWLVSWFTVRAHLPPGFLHATTSFAELSIDSLTAVEVSQELDQILGLRSPPMLIWSCPTPGDLAAYLADELHATSVTKD